MSEESKCPVVGNSNLIQGRTNTEWWPDELNLKSLQTNPPVADPMDPDFDYAEAFKSLDLAALKADLVALMPK